MMRNALATSIQPGAIGVPRVEHRLDSHRQLQVWILRKLSTSELDDHALVGGDERLQLTDGQVDVSGDMSADLRIIQGLLKVMSLKAENSLAEHLDESAIGIPRKALIARPLGQSQHAFVIEPDVQDGVHHPWHRESSTRAH